MEDFDTILKAYTSETATDTGAELTPDAVIGKYSHLMISARTPIECPPVLISAFDCCLLSPGNLMVVSGKSKGGKSALISLILAECIKTSNGIDGCINFSVAFNLLLKAIIHIDTEQSPHHQYRNFKNAVLKRARRDIEPPNFYSLNFMALPFEEYKKAIEDLFEALHQKHGGIHLAVIDGIADFITSVNDETESNAIIAFFRALSIKYNTGIILVIHLNPGEVYKLRGHLGSQLERKAETVLSIKKEKETDISVLEAQHMRSGGNNDFTPIRYQFDKSKGYHVFLDSGGPAVKSKGITPEALIELAERVFTKEITSGEACDLIMLYRNVAITKAKAILSDMVNAELLKTRKDGKCMFLKLKNSEDEEDISTPF